MNTPVSNEKKRVPQRLAIVGVLLVLGILTVTFISNLLWEVCSDRVIERQTSPDGRFVVAWLERDCGATTPIAYHLLLIPAGRSLRFSEQYVIFSCDHLEFHRAHWKGPNLLHVQASCGHVYRKEPEKSGVAISYDLDFMKSKKKADSARIFGRKIAVAAR